MTARQSIIETHLGRYVGKSVNSKFCVIFDIDGTLVDSSAFESALYISAIKEVLGEVSIRADWWEYEHVTDSGIVSEILRDCTPSAQVGQNSLIV